MAYPELRLKKGKDRALRNRHPWVFSGAIATPPDAPAGAVVRVVSFEGQALGYGHWQPDSAIRCRMLAFTELDLTLAPDFFERRFQEAWAFRQRFVALEQHTGYRLINAEGDRLPGLIVDRYGDVAVLQARTAGMQGLVPQLLSWLQKLGLKHVLDRSSEATEGSSKGEWLLGNEPVAAFVESNIPFIAPVEAGQKTGFFLDQRGARQLLGSLAKGRTLLNGFAYTGAFGAYALQHGAKHVVQVDSSEASLAYAARQAEELGWGDRHEATKADVFDYLKALEPSVFDMMVLDPPAFTKHLRTVDRAARGYKDINLRAMRAIAPEGLLFTFSCSQHISAGLFRKIVFGAAADAGRPIRVLAQTGHAACHPVDLYHPEGEYLKGLVLEVGGKPTA